jgi:hypothetical protein
MWKVSEFASLIGETPVYFKELGNRGKAIAILLLMRYRDCCLEAGGRRQEAGGGLLSFRF